MSAVDLGGSNERLAALMNGEVDVSGSFVRGGRHEPVAPYRGHTNNQWAQVYRPAAAAAAPQPKRAGAGVVDDSDQPLHPRRRSDAGLEAPEKENDSPQHPSRRAASEPLLPGTLSSPISPIVE